MEKKFFKFVNNTARGLAKQFIDVCPEGWVVTFSEPSRSLDQNAAQWPLLQAISEQLMWPVNGQMTKLTDEEFKDILTAAFRGDQVRLAQGVNGGVVMLGARTSKFRVKEFSEWLEFLHWFCSEKGVIVYDDRKAA